MISRQHLFCRTRYTLAIGVLAFCSLDSVRAQDKTSAEPTPVQPAAQPLPPPPVPVQVFDSVSPAAFKIGPNTPLKSLLPVPPTSKQTARPSVSEDLTLVPEVEFQQQPGKQIRSFEVARATSQLIGGINHLNSKKTDGFLKTLCEERSDLNGLPYAMGDACRMKAVRSQQFGLAVVMLRRSLKELDQEAKKRAALDPKDRTILPKDHNSADLFWKQYKANFTHEDWTHLEPNWERQEDVTLARIAALMQVLMPESAPMRLGLIRYLSHVSHAEATRSLARLAIYSAEADVRQAAIEALKTRRERDYTEIMLQGLRYPMPSVARRASEAVVKLERTDLLPQLVKLLDEPDPRLPAVQEINKKQVPVVREVVRLNHNKNCLLCHAPGDPNGGLMHSMVTSPIPIQGEEMGSPSDGYQNSAPDVLVRIDMTYLRQDFSVMQPVADAAPWPDVQRFDFLVRTRQLTEKEAVAYRETFGKRSKSDALSPYQQATVSALRNLSGKDAEATTEAWRRVLGLNR